MCAIFFLFCILVPPAAAQSTGLHYVSDHLVIVVREGPTVESSKLTTISTGVALAVIETNDQGFSRVRLDNGTEGWVQHRYLTAKPPATTKLVEAEEELAVLRIERQQLDGAREALSIDKRDLQQKLATLEKAFNQMKAELSDAQSAARSSLTKDSGEIADLREQVRLVHLSNQELRETEELRWFVAGGSLAVLCVLLGLIGARWASRSRRNW